MEGHHDGECRWRRGTHARTAARARAVGGHVVFINSGAGRTPSPGLASYSASKFALRAFADSLRADEPALRVTTVYPGRVDTDMQRDLVAYEGGEYQPERFLKPETVAQLVAQAVNAPPDADVHEVVVRPHGGRSGRYPGVSFRRAE